MAPDPASSYFPLERCVNGDKFILSWNTALHAITNEDVDSYAQESVIRQFFADPEVARILSNPFDAFSPPSSDTKSRFEQQTAAINVTPLANSRDVLKELKEDALWLSQAVSVDEVAALRIAVVEYQNRTSEQLLAPFSEEEVAGIREAAGNNQYSSAIPLSLLAQGADPDETNATFNSTSARRQRLINTYLAERCSLLSCAKELLQAAFISQSQPSSPRVGNDGTSSSSWLQVRGAEILQTLESGNALLIRSFAAIKLSVQNLERGCTCFAEENGNAEMSLPWAKSQLTEIIHSMEIAFEVVASSPKITSSRVVLEWLRVVQSYQFFATFDAEEPSINALNLVLQSLTAVISLAILRLGRSIDQLADPSNAITFVDAPPGEEAYFLNKGAILEIQAMMLNAADDSPITAGPLLLGWSAFLQFIRLRAQESRQQLEEFSHQENSIEVDQALATVEYDDVIMQIVSSQADDPIQTLAIKAVDNCRVFATLSGITEHVENPRMRLVMLDLIQHTTAVGYVPEVIEALVSVLGGGQSNWEVLDSKSLLATFNPVSAFFQQESLVNEFLQNAASRFPFESAPFLQLVRTLASSPASYRTVDVHPVLEFLDCLSFFTYQLPDGFADYETIQEEDNNNNIQLLRSIDLFKPRTNTLIYGKERPSLALAIVDSDFTIAAGTHGRIISDSGPKIAFWFHRYSALKYFGKLLETFLPASNLVEATTELPADRDSVCDIIEILAALLSGISSAGILCTASIQDAIRVLETASSGLSRNRDIITVVFDIFEDELHKGPVHSNSESPLEVLVSCVHFMQALLPVYPRRVWPLLAQSGLFGAGRGGGRLSAIVEAVEIVSGRYEFLTSCCHLFEALVEDLVTNTVRRRTGAKSNARYDDGNDFETGISDPILSKTLVYFTKYLINVLESAWTWKFAIPNNRRRLIKTITSTFDLILQYSFGLVHNSSDNAKQLMGTLVPSASVIAEAFLSTSSGTLRFQPLLCSFYDGLETPASAIFRSATRLWTSHINSILSFSATLLRVGTLLGRPASQLENQIFKASPIIARLYGMHDSYQKPTLMLFEALILAASSHTSEPPSLLAHLGPQTSRNFIQILSDLSKPLSRTKNTSAIWHFLTVVVISRQQWFSNYLLTGKTPRAALQRELSKKDAATIEKPFLTTVLEKMTSIKTVPRAETLAMLEFVASAQNFWPWTVYGSDKYDLFIKSLLEFVGELKPIQRSGNPLDPVHQTRISAYVAEILAMYLFHSRQTGIAVDFKVIRTNLDYFTRFAVAVPPYNSSLHGNLKRNFEYRYGGCKIQDFQRTGLHHRDLGKAFFYDLPLAEKMLHADVAWKGRNDDGLRNEVAVANINLSLVDAQIALFQSWKFLATELSSKLSTEPELQPLLAKVANDCLISNSRSQLSEEVFISLSQARADLALVLTQRLVQVGSSGNESKQLLQHVWENIRSLRGSFERMLLGPEIPYYRTLLKLLFLSLRVHNTRAAENLRASVLAQSATSLTPILLDILKNVVASGLRELASSLHSTPSTDAEPTYTPEDLALLTGVLHTILKIPAIELHSQTLVNIFSTASTARVATTLFSWSDTLALNGDPIYGELSMLFLLELSAIPSMAEQMAIDGVLGQIAAANITSYLRLGNNVGPFVTSSGGQRCYSIWVRGMLPFLLNLLDGVQLPIAGEISLFLAQFPALLAQSSQFFESPETNRLLAKGQSKFITLASCSEVHSLALITYILNGFRQQAGGEAIVEVDWDISGVGENVEWWLGSRALLKDRIVPVGEREAEWARRKGGDGDKSLLEEQVIAELLGVRDVLGAGD